MIDSEILVVCRKIAASLIRLKRQMRELADDVEQIRKKITELDKRIKL